jgi:hypothetical protein
MSVSIIHNSDYESVGAAKAAIGRYFRERNEYFKKNPKRAGNKIWGLQEVVWVFWATSEGWKHACEHLEPQIFLVA